MHQSNVKSEGLYFFLFEDYDLNTHTHLARNPASLILIKLLMILREGVLIFYILFFDSFTLHFDFLISTNSLTFFAIQISLEILQVYLARDNIKENHTILYI